MGMSSLACFHAPEGGGRLTVVELEDETLLIGNSLPPDDVDPTPESEGPGGIWLSRLRTIPQDIAKIPQRTSRNIPLCCR